MPQEVYTLVEFKCDRTYEKLVDSIKRGLVSGDISDEETARTKRVLSLYIKVNGDKVSFQISPYGKLTISHPDNSKLRKARSKLEPLILCSQWVPKYVSNETKELKPYWYEFAGARVYESEVEFTLALSHSKNIASGLEHLRESLYPVKDDLMSEGKKYKEHALTHLRTGYPELYAVFEKAEAFKSQIEQKEKELMDAVKRRLIALSLPTTTLCPENVARAVYEDIKAALMGHEPFFLTNYRVNEGRVRSGAYTFAKEEVAEQVRDFIQKEEASEENRLSGRRIVDLENKYYDLIQKQKLEKKIEDLIVQVENGTPFRGSCQMCPRVKVSRLVTEKAKELAKSA